MIKFDYTIKDALGIHARPAGELVKLVKTFESTVTINKDGKEADCRKILGVMGLGVKKDNQVTITVDGNDEEKAAGLLKEFFEKNL